MSSVNKETLRWAYRLFWDREPENDSVLEQQFPSTTALRNAFLDSTEFRNKNSSRVFNPDAWVIKETTHGFRIWVSLNELSICRPILNDAYDVKEAEILKGMIRTGDTVFDIGTNIGFYSLLLSKIVGPGGQVHGFEPFPFLFNVARRSILENHYQAFCTIHNLALSNTEGTLSLRDALIMSPFCGGHISSTATIPDKSCDGKVAVSRLDGFMPQSTVRLIKIGVEGAEPMVIEGGRMLIARDKPVILSGLNNAKLKAVSNTTATIYIKQLRELGYACFAVADTAYANPMEAYDGDCPANVLFIKKT
jgi:FkbM family methyltransferase